MGWGAAFCAGVVVVAVLWAGQPWDDAMGEFVDQVGVPAGMSSGRGTDRVGRPVVWFAPLDPSAEPPASLLAAGIVPSHFHLTADTRDDFSDVSADVVACTRSSTGKTVKEAADQGLFVNYNCSGLEGGAFVDDWPLSGDPSGRHAVASYHTSFRSGRCDVFALIGDPRWAVSGVPGSLAEVEELHDVVPWVITVGLERADPEVSC